MRHGDADLTLIDAVLATAPTWIRSDVCTGTMRYAKEPKSRGAEKTLGAMVIATIAAPQNLAGVDRRCLDAATARLTLDPEPPWITRDIRNGTRPDAPA